MLRSVTVAVTSQHARVSSHHMVHFKLACGVCQVCLSEAGKRKALYKNQGHFSKVCDNIPISVH